MVSKSLVKGMGGDCKEGLSLKKMQWGSFVYFIYFISYGLSCLTEALCYIQW